MLGPACSCWTAVLMVHVVASILLPWLSPCFLCPLLCRYIQAATSPKDIVIIVDVSGSMKGLRMTIAKHTIITILDTLGENDFVNIIAVCLPPFQCWAVSLVPHPFLLPLSEPQWPTFSSTCVEWGVYPNYPWGGQQGGCQVISSLFHGGC